MIMTYVERQVANKLQRYLTKREAEDAIYDIRQSLYGDIDEEIRPMHIVTKSGRIIDDYPSIGKLIYAYEHDDYSAFPDAWINQ